MKSNDLRDKLEEVVVDINKTNEEKHRGTISVFSHKITLSNSEKKLKMYETKSKKEVLLHELFHIAVFDLMNIENYEEYKNLQNIYDYAKNSLNEKSFIPHNATAKQIRYAKELYEYLFEDYTPELTAEEMKNSKSIREDIREEKRKENREIKLQEFAVHIMTNELVSNRIKEIVVRKDLDQDYERIVGYSKKIIDFFAKSDKNFLDRFEESIKNRGIFSHLMQETHIIRNGLIYADKFVNELATEEISEFLKNKRDKIGKRIVFGKDDSISTPEHIGLYIYNNKLSIPDAFRNGIYNILYEAGYNNLADSIKQVMGLPSKIKSFRSQINRSRAKIEIESNSSRQIIEDLFNKTIKNSINEKELEVFNDLIYKTESMNIVDSVLSIDDMFDKNKIESIVRQKEASIRNLSKKNHEVLLMQTELLGKASIDKDTNGVIIQNAYSIFSLLKSKKQIDNGNIIDEYISFDNKQKLINDIDTLSSLYSLLEIHNRNSEELESIKTNIDGKDMKKVISIMHTTHKKYYKNIYTLSEKKKEKFPILFDGIEYDKSIVEKGIIPLEYDNKISYKMVTEDKIKEYSKIGYSIVSDDHKLNIGDKKLYLMSRMDISLRSHVRGAMSRFSLSTDTIQLSSIIDESIFEKEEFMGGVVKEISSELDKQLFEKKPRDTVVPRFTIKQDGSVGNVKFQIPEKVEKEDLQREEKANVITGLMEAEVTAKLGSYHSNIELYDVLKGFEDILSNKNKEAKNINYITIGENTNVDYYNKLPSELKNRIKEDGSLKVPKSLINEVFGVSVISLVDYKPFEDFFNNHEKLKRWVEISEKIIGDIHSLEKGKEVIKTPDTWVGNITSNVSYLGMRGYNIDKVTKESYALTKEVQDYQTLKVRQTEIFALGDNKTDKDKRELKEIKEKLSTNNIAWAFNNGFYESLVDDIADADANINKNLVESTIKKLKKNHLNPTAGMILDELYMADNTFAYKFSNYMLTHGDFFAKIIVFRDIKSEMENEMKRRLSNKEKIDLMNEINIDFINYAVPQSQILEYMNKMGFFYSKFLFGIPQTLVKTAISNPVSVATFHATEGVLDTDFEDHGDALTVQGFLNRFRSPLESMEQAIMPTYVNILKKFF